MNKQITVRLNQDPKGIEAYINEHLSKIEEFLANEREPVFIEIVAEPSKVHAHHRVEIRVKTAHYSLIADFEGPEFYKVADKALDTMYYLLHEKKRQMIQERKH